MIEMTFDPLQFGEYVFAHRVGDIDMVTRDLQVHRFAPICLYGFLDVQRIPAGQASGFRSCEGGMPRPSRYLATVLLATCMPSFKSSSDSVASDSGRDAFSPVIMRLIMAWIAVAAIVRASCRERVCQYV